jgi:hypothetical protein
MMLYQFSDPGLKNPVSPHFLMLVEFSLLDLGTATRGA